MTLYLVKLGGSRITHPGGEKRVDEDSLADLCRQVGKWWKERREGDYLIVVHGAGGFGHVGAKRLGVRGGDVEGRVITEKDLRPMALIHAEVRELHLTVLKALLKAGVSAYSHPPYPSSKWLGNPAPGRAADISSLKLLKGSTRGLVPLTFGDLIEDPTLNYSVISGDHLIYHASLEGLSTGLPVKVIFVMSERGIRDGDRYLKAMTPGEARRLLTTLKGSLSSRGEVDVTGGITLKLRVGIELAERGAEVVYTDGRENSLLGELEGRVERATRIMKK